MKFNLGFCLCHTMQFFVCMPLWKYLWLYEPDPIVVGTNQTIWLVGDAEIFMYRTAGPEAVRCIIYSATLSRHLSVNPLILDEENRDWWPQTNYHKAHHKAFGTHTV